MAQTKEISRRIKSVANTKKITKAMEMVAASKMKKAVEAVLKSKAYASLSWETVLRLAEMARNQGQSLHPLLAKKDSAKKVAVIVISSNRGLCGGFNTAIIAKTKESISKHEAETELILMGKKASVMASWGYKVVAEFDKPDLVFSSSDVSALTSMVMQDYLAGRYDKIFVAYTDFISPARQKPRVKQVLPVETDRDDFYLGQIEISGIGKEEAPAMDKREYLFEPNANIVLDKIVPRLVEVQLYQALLEANASEHSARMASMHQATEAADDMSRELTLFFNKARQAGITAEIAEISSGANALAD